MIYCDKTGEECINCTVTVCDNGPKRRGELEIMDSAEAAIERLNDLKNAQKCDWKEETISELCDGLDEERSLRRGGGMKPILDACCGAKMFWFDKKNPNVEFCDKRVVSYHEYYKNRYIEIKPDIVCDFTNLPFPDKSFKLVVFDPPHLTQAGKTLWMALKYGCLDDNWPTMIHDGFWECMRVLDDYGTLIFKWSEVQIPLRDVLKAIKAEPLFGHRSGKHNNTHWMAFMKFPKEEE